MGTSAKRKKEKKKDFQKTKLKVGKGAKKPENATNTAFKARCELIVVVSLSIGQLADPRVQQSS